MVPKSPQYPKGILQMAVTASGDGYCLVSSSGGGLQLWRGPVVRLGRRTAPVDTRRSLGGYALRERVLTESGNVFNFGDARFFGSPAQASLFGDLTGFAVDF